MHEETILLVDDHPLFRDGFTSMAATLRPSWRIEIASSAADALQIVASASPDLVLVDIVLLDGEGFALVDAIEARWPTVPCALISGREDVASRQRASACGARGFIAKTSPPDQIVAALDIILSGSSSFVGPPMAHLPPVALSRRQNEVLQLLAEGHSNKEIRHRLDIAERTVRAHLTDLFQTLGAQSRMQAVLRAREIGLIP